MIGFYVIALLSWLSARTLERALGDARSRAERLAVVNRIAKAAGATLRLDDLVETVYREIVPIFQADAFFVALYDEDADELDFRIRVDKNIRETPGRRPLRTGLTSLVISEEKPLVIRDFQAEQEHLPQGQSFGTMKPPASWLGVPMLIGGRVIGVISVQSYRPYAWDEEDELLLFTIADQVAVAIENAELYGAVQQELAERKQAEENLRVLNLELDQRVQDRTQELAEAFSRNQAILEGIADGVIVFDDDGRAIVANPAVTGLIGWPARKVVGHDIQTLMGDDVTEENQEVIIDLLRNREMRYPSVKLEWGDKTLSVSIAPVHLAPGETIGSVAVFRDFTREAEIDRMKSSFVSTASHELRTPLSAILGYADMLQEGVYGSLSEKQSATMERIVANTGRLLSLVGNLLDQAQIEAGTLELDTAPFVLADLVDDVLSVMTVLAQAKGLELTSHVANDLPVTLFGDRQRLHQILINLVSNAIKFTDEGAVRVRAYRLDLDRWALEVSDTGRGISSEAHSRIFEPFRHADDSFTREYAGAGLGLSIVKQLTRIMKGEILLESEVGRGSTFAIALPMVPV
jgi:PAS domain S-box-containing protein